jgi:hypothetical protein
VVSGTGDIVGKDITVSGTINISNSQLEIIIIITFPICKSFERLF